ncbi:MAG: hypothetical protein A2Z25_24090 [Planctomycetes bacterium RBG_16_55_9]|nr:MAG: hypothetical protein A2Z25_24090 [Planctomycetes bacterium RBG_16_55_9]
MLISLAGLDKNPDASAEFAARSGGSAMLRAVALAGVSLVFAWALFGANKARVAEAHWTKARAVEEVLNQKDWQGSYEEYADLIGQASAATDNEPDNVNYRYWLNVYRWHSVSCIADPNTGTVIIPEQAMEFVHRVVKELHDARRVCPTYGAICSVVGQLEYFMLDDPNGADLIEKGFQLAPSDPTACFVAGLLDAEQGDAEASYAKLSRAVQLDGALFGDAVNLCVEGLDRPDLAVAMAGESPNRLSQVADALRATEEYKEVAEKVRAQVVDLLKKQCSEPDAPAAAFASLANVYVREGDHEAAIKLYRRALALDYSQIQWRFNLARLLADTGRIPEAIHEARIGLRLRPQFKAAEKLIADLSVSTGAAIEKSSSPKVP